MRVATIDIGTNSVLLLVAERTSAGAIVAVEERATVTRLGQGVDRTRTLAPEAIARTRTCLEDYAASVRRHAVARVAVVGTSAMRDAKGSDAMRACVRELFASELRVISGDEEARLTFAGALSGLDIDASADEITVFDIGGGSTEVVTGNFENLSAPRRIRYAKSFDVGSVRLTERHAPSDPPTREQRAAMEAEARLAFSGVPKLAGERDPIGIAGTVTTLAAIDLRLSPYDGARVHGHTMSLARLEEVVEELAVCTLESRCKIPGLDPKRADVIVAGGLVTVALLRQLGARGLRASDRGVRWGLAEESLGLT